jgi:hypothetical protein
MNVGNERVKGGDKKYGTENTVNFIQDLVSDGHGHWMNLAEEKLQI